MRFPCKRFIALLCATALVGCATTNQSIDPAPPTPSSAASDLPGVVAPFSGTGPGDLLPVGWKPWILARFKRPTAYRLVRDATTGGRSVIRASADQSASGLIHPITVDLTEKPLLTWRWKVNELIKTADNTSRTKEDSPVRLVVTFSGDHNKLDLGERLFANQVKAVTGELLPYATLMYIWENRAPKETLITSHHTGRIKMIVAESGKDKLGAWQEVTRNVYEDYQKAFGEAPPPVSAIAIMTDTDNTGEKAFAYYGDIGFKAK